jgi:branched-chain amino acid transport system permease protein
VTEGPAKPPEHGRVARGRLTSSRRVEAGRKLFNRNPLARYVLPLVLMVLAFLYPWWYELPGIDFVTLEMLGIDLDTAIQMMVYVMLALGLNIVVGYAGLLDLGYVAFFAIGAYAVGWFASDLFSQRKFRLLSIANEALLGIHINVWLVLILAGVAAAIAGVIIGWPTLRLRGDYLAIVTLGFGEIIPDVFRNADAMPVPEGLQGKPPFLDFGEANLTGGVRGVRLLDRPGFGETLSDWSGGILPERFTSSNLEPWYGTIVVLVLITIFVNVRLRDSKMGRAWIAVREDEVAASAMGVPLMRTKLWAYGIGAIFGGIVGAYYGTFVGSVFPTGFSFQISIIVLCMVIVGGMGNIYGVVLGALVLRWLDWKGLDKIGERLNQGLDGLGIDREIEVPKYKFLIFGILLVVMMLFRPQGLIPEARRQAEFEDPQTEGGREPVLYDAKS